MDWNQSPVALWSICNHVTFGSCRLPLFGIMFISDTELHKLWVCGMKAVTQKVVTSPVCYIWRHFLSCGGFYYPHLPYEPNFQGGCFEPDRKKCFFGALIWNAGLSLELPLFYFHMHPHGQSTKCDSLYETDRSAGRPDGSPIITWKITVCGFLRWSLKSYYLEFITEINQQNCLGKKKSEPILTPRHGLLFKFVFWL